MYYRHILYTISYFITNRSQGEIVRVSEGIARFGKHRRIQNEIFNLKLLISYVCNKCFPFDNGRFARMIFYLI